MAAAAASGESESLSKHTLTLAFDGCISAEQLSADLVADFDKFPVTKVDCVESDGKETKRSKGRDDFSAGERRVVSGGIDARLEILGGGLVGEEQEVELLNSGRNIMKFVKMNTPNGLRFSAKRVN